MFLLFLCYLQLRQVIKPFNFLNNYISRLNRLRIQSKRLSLCVLKLRLAFKILIQLRHFLHLSQLLWCNWLGRLGSSLYFNVRSNSFLFDFQIRELNTFNIASLDSNLFYSVAEVFESEVSTCFGTTVFFIICIVVHSFVV